jgi:hypothetical protein
MCAEGKVIEGEVIDYAVVCGENRDELEELVKEWIAKGWTVQGGVSVAVWYAPTSLQGGGVTHSLFAQTVIKREEVKREDAVLG